MIRIDARWVMTEDGWRRGARVTVGDDGRVAAIADAPAVRDLRADLRAGASSADWEPPDATADLVLPGMPDAHGRAWQYASAGLCERAGAGAEGLRGWHERMLAAAGALGVEALERTATALYRRLRACGYTAVAEFHALHRLGPENGRRGSVASAIESAHALCRAAMTAGVSLLLLPVLHRWGGYRRAELGTREARFALARDDYRRVVETLLAEAADPALRGMLRVGVAAQSLRACDRDDLRWLLELRDAVLPGCPVHLPISERAADVRDARAALGASPIAWLCAQLPVDASWTLVNASQASGTELRELLARDATLCVCPSSEADLGEGSLAVEDWVAAGGSLAIGGGSHVGPDPAEELRWLEYGARLRRGLRPVLVDRDRPHPGVALWRRAVAGGRRALGIGSAGLAVGAPAELLLLACDEPLSPDEAIDDFVFARRLTRIGGTVTPAGLALHGAG